MVLFFNAETTVGNILADRNKERSARSPWDNFLPCIMRHFFDRDTPQGVPVRRVLTDRPEGKFNYM